MKQLVLILFLLLPACSLAANKEKPVQKQLSEMTIVEIKAAMFDRQLIAQKLSNEMQQLAQEIQRREEKKYSQKDSKSAE